MAVKKLCLGDTVVFDRDEIMDAIYGLMPPLAVQMHTGEVIDASQWLVSDDQGDVWGDTSKLYRYLTMIANQASDDSCLLSNGDTIRFKRSGSLMMITDSANAQLARDEYRRTGASWFWCIHEVDKVRLPLTKHFINFTESLSDVGKYSQDQIVDIVGGVDRCFVMGGDQPIVGYGPFEELTSYVTPTGGTIAFHRYLSNGLVFKASNSTGVNVGQWVQPRATALRLAFYVGFLKQSRFKDL